MLDLSLRAFLPEKQYVTYRPNVASTTGDDEFFDIMCQMLGPLNDVTRPLVRATTENVGRMRLLACVVAAVVYVWQEQREYSFPQFHFAAFILGIGVLSASLCLFQRGPSRIQPPEAIAGFLRFIGRHTLEIYAIQLAGFELLIKLVPDLAP